MGHHQFEVTSVGGHNTARVRVTDIDMDFRPQLAGQGVWHLQWMGVMMLVCVVPLRQAVWFYCTKDCWRVDH